ncbi:hypothetical protein VNO78_21003 [Psophocarpus tetragonolobus]|uniref:Uncharacterized protein n=1 Tax=Psophocarpus tetragonolobus TaxID=3891 RepID=A0AAN9XHM8_PSOTE
MAEESQGIRLSGTMITVNNGETNEGEKEKIREKIITFKSLRKTNYDCVSASPIKKKKKPGLVDFSLSDNSIPHREKERERIHSTIPTDTHSHTWW